MSHVCTAASNYLRAASGPHLHCDQPVVYIHFLGQEISANGGLVLVAELLVHVLVHERSLAHPATNGHLRALLRQSSPGVTEDDDLEKNFLAGRHAVRPAIASLR